jgi:hypothetical protein
MYEIKFRTGESGVIKTYDVKCAELARTFLADEGLATEDNVRNLAIEIQDVIEGYLEGARDRFLGKCSGL